MTVREQAKAIFDHEVVGKLKRLKDVRYGIGGSYPLYIDEAGTEYLMDDSGKQLQCLVFDNGAVR